MLERLKRLVGLASAAGGGRADLHVFRIEFEGQPRDVLSLIPINAAFEEGFPRASIIGFVRNPIQPGQAVFEIDENPEFVDLLHAVIARHAPSWPQFQKEARRQKEGWIYVIDGRTPDPGGEVPGIDIIGAFELNSGVCCSDSYRRNPNHRLMTERGLFKLPPALHRVLLEQVSAMPD